MKVKERIRSLIEIGAKTALSLLPTPLSAAFDAIYDNVKESVLTKRAEKWKNDVVSRLEKLEMEYESLINSETFATTLIKASELAIKTESDEKRTMLADALANTIEYNLDETKTLTFLSLIEKYTVLHIQIIRYLHDEYKNEYFLNNRTPTFMALFRIKFNEVDATYLKKAIKDLQNDYLVEEFKDDSQVEFFNTRFNLLTKLGNDFYDYLKPNAEKK